MSEPNIKVETAAQIMNATCETVRLLLIKGVPWGWAVKKKNRYRYIIPLKVFSQYYDIPKEA